MRNLDKQKAAPVWKPLGASDTTQQWQIVTKIQTTINTLRCKADSRAKWRQTKIKL